MKWKVYILLLTGVALMTACTRDDDDNNNNTTYGTFTVMLNGVLWEASTDKVSAVVANFGSGDKLSISATRGSDSSWMQLQIPYFTGSDTIASIDGTGQTVIVFVSDSSYSLVNGTLHVTRSLNGSNEHYSGTFSGDFKEVIFEHLTPATGGSFEVDRLL